MELDGYSLPWADLPIERVFELISDYLVSVRAHDQARHRAHQGQDART
jgi:hypothetical protein